MRKTIYLLFMLPILVQAQSRVNSTAFSVKKQTNQGAFSRNLDHKPLSIVTQRWDVNSNDWYNFADTTTITYNAEGLPVSKQTLFVSGTQQKDDYTYDANGNLTSQITFVNFGSQWDTSYIFFFTYDDKNNMTSYESYYLMGGTTRLIDTKERYNNTYDSNNRLTDRVAEGWVEHLNDYRNSYKQVLTYNSSGEPTTSVWQDWDTVGAAFVNESRITDAVWQRWTGSIDNMDDEFGFGSMLKSYNEQFWNGTAFQPVGRYLAAFDSKDNKLDEKYEVLNGTNWEIDFSALYAITYDTDSNMVTRITEEWNFDSADYVNSTKEVFGDYYTPPVGLVKTKANTLSVVVYPNPAQNNVIFVTPGSTSANIVFTDIQGKVVSQTQTTNDHTEINIENMNKGIYFYTITDANGNSTQGKLLVQ